MLQRMQDLPLPYSYRVRGDDKSVHSSSVFSTQILLDMFMNYIH